MRLFGSIRMLAAGLLILVCFAASGEASLGRQASEQSIKAGFVFNFAKFAQWPETREAGAAQLLICTPGSQALDGQLALLQGRQVRNRVIELRQNASADDWRNCDVLFLSGGDAHRMASIIRSIGDAPVLTVGDLPEFVQNGGMIGLHIDDKRVRFDINLAAAQRAGVKLNSQMLKLADEVLR